MKHGFIKVAVATPKVHLADCRANVKELKEILDSAIKEKVKLLVYPELSITGYTCADLFLSDVLLESSKEALVDFVNYTSKSDIISIVGFPLVVNDKIYNCGAICQKGQILGIIPKTQLLNFGENYEGRIFESEKCKSEKVKIGDMTVPFSTDILFSCKEIEEFKFAVEIGNCLLSPVSPSSYHTSNGATVIANPFASNEIVKRDDGIELLVKAHSMKNTCAYLLSNCGEGESTTDLVFGGFSLISENGEVLAKKEAFSGEKLLISEIDVKKLAFERRRMKMPLPSQEREYTEVEFSIDTEITDLTRKTDSSPFIPEDKEECEKLCKNVLDIQANGLKHRIESAYAQKCVIGISGGLDSCLALIAAAKSMDLLGRSRNNIVGVTMPCFGTTGRTKTNAEVLCEELGVEIRCIDIGEAVKLHFKDIGHDESIKNVVYENAQARERTQVIMDIANGENGLVVGTGDMSELALGWATYNGDHMSMYGVNASVPKTLVRRTVKYYADLVNKEGKKKLAEVLYDILDTPVSPELLPADENGDIAQKTEDVIGPYEIHDFYLYNMVRYGFAPDKLFRLAKIAFDGEYSDEILLKWLNNFVKRFFAQQFKRSCVPDGPKTGSVALSPRGDLRMPSDASRNGWMDNIEENIKFK